MITLQLGNVKINSSIAKEPKQLKNVLVNNFHPFEESIYIFWKKIPLKIKYKEDLGINFDSILAMTWLIQKEQQGKTKVYLTNQILNINWEIYWQDEELTIKARFDAIEDLYAPYAAALNRQSEIHINKKAFLAEWKTLLHQIIVVIKTLNIEFEDGKERRKWELLQEVEASIVEHGVLYAK